MEASQLENIRKQWGSLLKKGRTLSFAKGQVLFYEKHNPYGIYVIHSGKVRFKRGSKSCDSEHLRDMPEGRAIGIDHIINGDPHCCTCIAEEDCQVTFIAKTYLIDPED